MRSSRLLLLVTIFSCALFSPAHAQSVQETFAQYHKDLEALAQDDNLPAKTVTNKKNIRFFGHELKANPSATPKWNISFSVYSKAFAETMGAPMERVVDMPEGMGMLNYIQFTYGELDRCGFSFAIEKDIGALTGKEDIGIPLLYGTMVYAEWRDSPNVPHINYAGDLLTLGVQLAAPEHPDYQEKGIGFYGNIPVTMFSANQFAGYDFYVVTSSCNNFKVNILSTGKAEIWVKKEKAGIIEGSRIKQNEQYLRFPIPEDMASMMAAYMHAAVVEGLGAIYK